MSKLRIPSYRKHARKNHADVACVDLPIKNTKQVQRYYLGAYGTDESRHRYSWLIGAWMQTQGRELPVAPWISGTANAAPAKLFVSSARVAAHLVRHHRLTRRDASGSIKDRYNVLAAMRLMRDELQHRNLLDLTAHELDQVQASMVRRGWALATVRDRMRYVRAALLRAVKAGFHEHTRLDCDVMRSVEKQLKFRV